jgi:two-component system chemotaxis response regulator CheB
MTLPGRTRVLVCDDSPAYAESLAEFLGAHGDLEVVGTCATGEETLRALTRLTPDLVTMDLDLPGMGGIRAIAEIMRSHPLPIVVLCAGIRRGSDKEEEALAAGALEALPKTQVRLDDPEGPAAVALRHRLRRIAHRPVRSVGAPPRPGHATVVAVCASTGGPRALETVLTDLPADFPLPILVVQHIGRGFMDGLVRWLDRRAALPVKLATHGQPAVPGVWFAPEDAHLLLEPSMTLALDGVTDVGAHRPSADLLLESVAASAGAGAVGVVLTGMGRDGAVGVAAIRQQGGRAIAQDEESSAVFGMPRAAAEAGAETTLPISGIARALRRLAAVRVPA